MKRFLKEFNEHEGAVACKIGSEFGHFPPCIERCARVGKGDSGEHRRKAELLKPENRCERPHPQPQARALGVDMFAITGITGQVGGGVAHTLLDAGKSVRAIISDSGKGKIWAQQGCEVALARMEDPDALRRAFSGAEAVFVLLPPIFDPSPGFIETRQIVAALHSSLEKARPGRIVCISTIGAQATEENLLSQLGILEQGLSDLALPITFLRPGWYMENAVWDHTVLRTLIDRAP
jgi:NAD(P)H-binding